MSSSSSSNQVAANRNSQWETTVNLDLGNAVVSNLPDEIATLIFSNMAIEQVSEIMVRTETSMDRYSLYRNLISTKTSLTGAELVKFQRLLSIEGVTLAVGEVPQLKSWTDLLADRPISLSELQYFDLSDSRDISNADLIALTKDCKKLTKLILPYAFPSDEVMAVLRTNCPLAEIYPSAMTAYEWSHPAEFMAKLPPPPQAVADFINGPRPIWPGKTSTEVHMVMPKVNWILNNVHGRMSLDPWTIEMVNELDKETGGVGIRKVWDWILRSDNDQPSEVGFEWVVFTRDILPKSLNQSYDVQKELVEQWGYEMPGFIDATTCMLWENRISGNRIYNDNPWVYTRCKEKFNNLPVVVGGFEPRGLVISYVALGNDFIGIGGLKKFKV